MTIQYQKINSSTRIISGYVLNTSIAVRTTLSHRHFRTYPVIPYNKCLITKKLSVYPNIMISTLISDAAADGTLPPDAACSWINRFFIHLLFN